MAELGQGVAAFADFANHARDAYFMTHQGALRQVRTSAQKTSSTSNQKTGSKAKDERTPEALSQAS